MIFCYRNNIIDWRLVSLVILLNFIHIAAVQMLPFGNIVFLLENIALIYAVLRKRLDEFLYLITIIFATSFDVPAFVDDTADFLPFCGSLPVVKGYLFLLLCIALFPVVFSRNKWRQIKSSRFALLAKFAVNLSLIGVVMGIITMVIENTGLSFRIHMWGKHIVSLGIFSLLFYYYIYEYNFNAIFRSNIGPILFSLLTGIIISALISILVGFRGSYGRDEIILAPLSLFYSTCIICFWFKKEYRSKYKFLLLFLSLTSIFLQFSYANALGGKSWLAFFTVVIYGVCFLYTKSKVTFIATCVFIFVSLVPAFMGYVDSKKDENTKLAQAVLLLSVAEVGYDNIPFSPKARIEEFLNTCEEYAKYPYFALFGKGYGGGHRDHRQAYFEQLDGTFSEDQYRHGYFVFTHETVNVVFLVSGFYGLFLLVSILSKGMRYILYSPWMIVGCVWLFLYWGYSFSLMSIGLPALLIGFDNIPSKDSKVFA